MLFCFSDTDLANILSITRNTITASVMLWMGAGYLQDTAEANNHRRKFYYLNCGFEF